MMQVSPSRALDEIVDDDARRAHETRVNFSLVGIVYANGSNEGPGRDVLAIEHEGSAARAGHDEIGPQRRLGDRRRDLTGQAITVAHSEPFGLARDDVVEPKFPDRSHVAQGGDVSAALQAASHEGQHRSIATGE